MKDNHSCGSRKADRMNFIVSLVVLLLVVCSVSAGRPYRGTLRPVLPTTGPTRPIVCPIPRGFVLPGPREEPQCNTVATCAPGELCCNWFGTKYCLEGVEATPKGGQCPVGTVNPAEPCIADFPSCRFDSECRGNEKCCENVNCGYNQCKDPRTPQRCTKKGCRNTAGPNCRNVELIQPNGPECGPICRICRDDRVTPAPTPAPVNPRKNLGCPRSPFFFPITDTDSATCRVDTDCARDEKCCFFGTDERCKKGLLTIPKAGQCPVGTVNPNEPCRQDFVGCQYDSECGGDEKCCRNVNCGYSQCRAPATPRPCTRLGCRNTAGPDCRNVELIQPNGPECGPICRICRDDRVTPAPTPAPVDPRKNLACPFDPSFFPVTDIDSATCSVDTDCADDEKCCFFGTDERCKMGLITIPKPGVCPAGGPFDIRLCLADFGGCQFDSECDGSDKCCRNPVCGYSECTSLIRRATISPQVCTEIGCGPQAGPDCQNVELVRPNGPGCAPVCRVCADTPTAKPPMDPMTPLEDRRCKWVNERVCAGKSRRCVTLRKFLCDKKESAPGGRPRY